MKKGYTEIMFVLDESGSMQPVRDDTIGGVNQFIEDQKKVEGEVVFSLIKFSDKHEIVYNGMRLDLVPPLDSKTYVPNGWTALYDAIGTAINLTGRRLDTMPEEYKPENVIFVIQTDGKENSSKEFTGETVAKMIKHQKERYSWDFIFLGADQNAFETGGYLNIDRGSTMTYHKSAEGTQAAFGAVSSGVISKRSGVEQNYFSGDDQKIQDDLINGDGS